MPADIEEIVADCAERALRVAALVGFERFGPLDEVGEDDHHHDEEHDEYPAVYEVELPRESQRNEEERSYCSDYPCQIHA